MNKYAVVAIICLSFLAGRANFEKTLENIIKFIYSQESNQSRDKELAKKSIVKVSSQKLQCTGFIVGMVHDTAYILTVSHVVGNDQTPNIKFFGQIREFKARVLEIEGQQENGFALLAVTGSIPSDAIPLYVANKFDLKQGDSVFTFGFPRSAGNWAHDELFYSSRIAREILFSGSDMKEGNSGSPLIKGDKVVGMVTSVTDFAHANSSVSIREFLQGTNLGELYEEHLNGIAMTKPSAKSDDQLPKGIITAFAAEPGGSAIESSSSQGGVFTRYLLQEMQKSQNIEAMFKKVTKLVRDDSKKHGLTDEFEQRPWYNTSIDGEFCFGGCSKTSPNSVKQLALVIGNNSYKNIPLSFSIKDAQSVAKVLSEQGFEVILRTDVNRSEMYQSVQEFVERLSVEKGVGLFYFSGYGVQVGGKNYIIPVDHQEINNADDVLDQAVAVDYIAQQMQVSNNGELNIIILDAGRDHLRSSGLKQE